MISKESLLKEFFAFKGASDSNTDKLISRFDNYLDKKSDTEMTLILQFLKVTQADNEKQDFEKCCVIALPIFEHLEATAKWSFIEFWVLSHAIGYHSDYRKTLEFYQKVVDLVNGEFSSNPKSKVACAVMHINLTLRLLRAKKYEPDVDQGVLADTFMKCYNYGINVCKPRNIPVMHILEVRRGVFTNDAEMLQDGLKILDELGEKKMYKTTKDEITEYLAPMGRNLTKPLSTILLGYQVRKRRISLNMSTLDLAAAIDTDATTINSIERGEGGVSFERIKLIANALDVDLNYFVGDDEAIRRETDPHLLTIKALLDVVTEEDKNLVVNLARVLVETKYPDYGKLPSKNKIEPPFVKYVPPLNPIP